MITTALTSADDPAARANLETAAGLGIPYFKAGYYLYDFADVRRELNEPGGWQDANCPLGEGMVDWRYVCGVLARAGFHGPISLHLEYEVPGPTAAAHEENILAASQRDLGFLKERLREAYGVA